MAIRSGDGFLHFHWPVIAVNEGAEHPGDRHPLRKAHRRRFLRRRHPADQVINRPCYPAPDGPRGIFYQRVNAAPDPPVLRNRRPVRKIGWVVAVTLGYWLAVSQEDATAQIPVASPS